MKKHLFAFLLVLLLLIPSMAIAGVQGRVQIKGDVVVPTGEVLNGDAVAVIGNVIVDGKVNGDIVAVMGSVNVNGEVTGDVTAVGGYIIKGENGKVYGDINEIGLGQGISGFARNLGRPRFNSRSWSYNNVFPRNFSFFNVANLLGLIALGSLLVVFFPNIVKNALANVDKMVGRKALIGFGSILLLPIAIVLTAITIIGIPLIPVIIGLFIAAGFFGYVAITIYLGRKITQRIDVKSNIFLELAIGALLLWLIKFVPFFGGLSSLVVLIIGVGLAADTRFGTKAV